MKRGFKLYNQKSFYNRETIAAFNYEIFNRKCLSHETQIINSFLYSRISANHDWMQGLLANGENLIHIFTSCVHKRTSTFYLDQYKYHGIINRMRNALVLASESLIDLRLNHFHISFVLLNFDWFIDKAYILQLALS